MAVLAGATAKASDIPGDGASADVATSEATASAAYVDLATAGPAVSVTLVSGQQCLVILACQLSGTGTSTRMSYAVSGASTVAAVDADNIQLGTTGVGMPGSRSAIYTATASGSHTFTAKYRVGSGTGTYAIRRIIAIPISV